MGLLRRNRHSAVDLRDPVPGDPRLWGSPLPCPTCAGRGYLDHIDPFKEVMYLHCTACDTKFEVHKSDLTGVVA